MDVGVPNLLRDHAKDPQIPPPADGLQPVRFYPVLPMTGAEAALARAKGAAAVQKLWLDSNTDLRDPNRRSAL